MSARSLPIASLLSAALIAGAMMLPVAPRTSAVGSPEGTTAVSPPAALSASAELPPPPVLLAPAQGETADGEATFSWTPVDGATHYRLEIAYATPASPPDPFERALTIDTQNTHVVKGALAVGEASWRVSASRDGVTFGVPSAVRTLDVVWTAVPVRVAPADGAVFDHPSSTPVLRWDPIPYASGYEVQVTRLEDGDVWDGSIVRVEAHAPDLPSGTYEWRVRGTGVDQNLTSWSTTGTFTVTWSKGTPAPVAPADGALAREHTLIWSDVPGAAVYELEVDYERTFPHPKRFTVSGTHQRLGPQVSPGTWYWRVRALESLTGTTQTLLRGPWSAIGTFEVAATPVPGGLWPASGETLDTLPTLRWEAVRGAGTYVVQVAASAAGLDAPYPTTCTLPHNAASFRRLGGGCLWAEPGDVFWRVRVHVGDEVGQWSPVATFRYRPKGGPPLLAPVAAVPLGPGHCPPDIACDPEPTTPILRWAEVPGAAFYRVQIGLATFTGGRTYDAAGTSLIPEEVRPATPDGHAEWWMVVACPSLEACPDWTAAGPTLRAYRIVHRTATLLEPGPDQVVGHEVRFRWSDMMPTGPAADGLPALADRTAAKAVAVSTNPSMSPWVGTPYGGIDEAWLGALPAGDLHWRVSWGDPLFGDYSSAVGHFVRLPASPTPLTPADGSVVTRPPALHWSAVSPATGYEVELLHLQDGVWTGVGPAVGVGRLTTAIPGAPLAPGVYRWRVRALGGLHGNPQSPGPWSASRGFVVAEPNGPTLVTPSGSVQPADRVILDWRAVTGAGGYTVEVSTAADFTTLVATSEVDSTGWAPTAALPPGTLYWRSVVRDRADQRVATSAARSITTLPVDTTAPIATAPRARLTVGSRSADATVPVLIDWAANDAGTGVARYELSQSLDGGRWTTVASTLTGRSQVRSLSIGHTYRFRVRATDRSGNVGTWATAPSFRPRYDQETSPRIAYAGKWKTGSSTAYLASSCRFATATAATATFRATARSIAWVASRGPTRGSVAVYIDGVRVSTVSLYQATWSHRVVVFSRSWSTAAAHTVMLKVLGTPDHPRADVDAFAWWP